MKKLLLLSHSVAILLVSGILLTVYVAVQQCYRRSANDPQTEIAGHILAKINDNSVIQKYLPRDTVEISEDPGVFVELLDSNRRPVYSTGFLYGRYPEIPSGALQYAQKFHVNKITWQPNSQVRIALVIQSTDSPEIGYIISGRSLKTTEIREAALSLLVLVSWILSVFLILIHYLAIGYIYKAKIRKNEE